MSWIKDLYRTYDACAKAVGVSIEGQDKMLLPIGHVLKRTDAVIYLRSDGAFERAEESTLEICSPCTDESESRTSGAKDAPHPLFDQLKHITGDLYIENLDKWIVYLESVKKYPIAYRMLTALAKYIKCGTISQDLTSCSIKPVDNLFLRFCVSIYGHLENRLWMLPEMWEAWSDYFLSQGINKRETKDVCYIAGTDNSFYTEKHPKSINRASGNAKLITGNDDSNFTYRGRFVNTSQALTVSYEASQKAHQVLRWLIATRGYRCGTQAIIAWAIDNVSFLTTFYEDSYGIYESVEKSDSDKLIEVQNQTFIDYSRLLNSALLGSGNVNRLKAHNRKVAIMALDASTTGRMSITYYRNLGENEYLERVVNWHNTCRWFQPFGKDKSGKRKGGYFIGAPSFDRIVEAVLGKKKGVSDDSYDKQKKSTRERLLHCVFDGERIPLDLVSKSVYRASNPLPLEKTSAKSAAERWEEWEQVLCAACALVRRYYRDYEGEEFDVALESQRTDRDYLYGRLLAIADRIESAARYKQGTIKDDARATNAIRYMPAFAQHPFRTWNLLFTQQLNPYIQQLNGAGWYINQIEDIMNLFRDGEFESDSCLSGKYLLGFFAQRQSMQTKSGEKKTINGGDLDESK